MRLEAVETTAGFFDVFGLPPLAGRVYTEARGPARRTARRRRVRVVLAAASRRRERRRGPVHPPERRADHDRRRHAEGVRRSYDGADLWMLAPRRGPDVAGRLRGRCRWRSATCSTSRPSPGCGPMSAWRMANDDLRAIGERLAREHPDTNQNEAAAVIPYQESLVGDVQHGAAGAVRRRRVRAADCLRQRREPAARARHGAASRVCGADGARRGAGPPRAATAHREPGALRRRRAARPDRGVLGHRCAWSRWRPSQLPRLADVGLDPRVTAFAMAASVLVGVLFGIAPAFQSARRDVVDALKDGGRTGTARTRLAAACWSSARSRWRSCSSSAPG